MENLCYFLETNFSDLCELFLYISIAGFIIYLPFRSHWGKIFSFSNSMVFYACLAIPVICMMSAYQSVKPVTMGERIVLILITAVCAIVGPINLHICWDRCSNILEVIFLPLMFVCSIGVLCLLILLAFLAIFSASHDDYY